MEINEEHVDPNEVIFSEHHAAAQSLKNAWTRLASTYGCMMVVLYRNKLMIKPHWYVRWLINLLGLDLCHEIPITNIKGVMEVGKWFSYGKVEVRFNTVAGEDRSILLYMKKYSEFIDKVKNVITQ